MIGDARRPARCRPRGARLSLQPDGGTDPAGGLLEPRATPADEGSPEERGTSQIELLWDLVFVFAVTQVTTLLSAKLTWAGFGEAMLALALMWWAWSAFVWAANAQATESRALQMCLLLAMVFIFIAGLALPRAFRNESTLFAVSYALVRFLHLALYADASRQGNAAWSAIAGFAITVLIGMALLIGGSFLHGVPRAALWTAAIAIDYAGPAWLTRERLRGLQRVAVAHFSERYGLFVIICLGESIFAIGVGANNRPLDAARVFAVSLGLLITSGMWWTYFARLAATAAARLREHEDPVLAAADGYSYLHLVIVAGIIIFAVGVRLLVRQDVDTPLTDAARLCLCGGVALYLAGAVAFGLRLIGTVGYEKLVVAVALLMLYAFGSALAAWSVALLITALMAALCVVENLGDRETQE